MYCEDDVLVKRSTSLQMFGVMLGSLSMGQISDSLGRKWPSFISLLMMTFLGFASYFCSDFTQFTIIRTIQGIFLGAQSTVSVVYMVENIPKKSRMWISTAISYSPNVLFFGIIAYFFQEWRMLSFVVSLLAIPALVLTLYLSESPRWLIQKGQIKKAREVMLRISEIDGQKSKINVEYLDKVLEKEYEQFKLTGSKKYSYWHLFSRKNLAIATCVLAFSCFACVTVNYANMFNLGNLSGSIYLNSILIGSFRYITNLICGVLDLKVIWFGRKVAHTSCQAVIVLCLAVVATICSLGYQEQLDEIVRFCVVLICAMASQVVIVDSVTSNELFPTSIRTICYSFVQVFSRLGIVIAPHIFTWAETWYLLPYAFLLAIAVLDLILFPVLLTESKHKPMENHIASKNKGVEI